MGTVQMNPLPLGDGGHARIAGEVVPVAHHHRLAHPGLEGGAWHGAVVSPDLRIHHLVGPIQHHLLPGPLPLGIPGHRLARAVVGIIGASYIAVEEFRSNPPIKRLGGIHILIKSGKAARSGPGSKRVPPGGGHHAHGIWPFEGGNGHGGGPFSNGKGRVFGLENLRSYSNGFRSVPQGHPSRVAHLNPSWLIGEQANLQHLIPFGLEVFGDGVGEGGSTANHHTLTNRRSHTQIKRINIGPTNLIVKNGAIHHICCGERRREGQAFIDRGCRRREGIGGKAGRLGGVVDRHHRCGAHLAATARIAEHPDVEGFGPFRGEIVRQGLADLELARGIHHTRADHRAADEIRVGDPSA